MNNVNLLISVIIPVYNASETIKMSLFSFVNQTYKSFKLIIVNDGSQDETENVIKSFCQENDLDVEYTYQDNQGVSSARNKGLSMLKTDYVMFCDADDEYHPRTIEYIMKYLKEGNYDVLGIGHTRSRDHFENNPKESKTINDINVLKKEILFKNKNYNFVDLCYKADIIIKNHILFDVSLKYGEDELFVWKYISYCKTINKSDIPYYFYLDNITSATKNVNLCRTQVIESQIKVLEYLESLNDPFAPMIKKYGIPRAKLAILKEFAQSHKREYFDWLSKTPKYDCRISNLLSFKDFRIKCAAMIYCISPKLFYKLLS